MTDVSNATPCILLLEDSAIDAELISEQIARIEPSPRLVFATSRLEFMAALAQHRCDLVLSDYSLPDFDGMAALDIVVEHAPETPFIFVSGVLGEDAAIDAFRRGATDYVLKQKLNRLPSAVERALSEARERHRRRHAEHQREILVRELSHRVKNNMAVMLSLIRRTARVAKTVEEFERSLSARVTALADGHALLFENNWNETALHDVLTRAAASFDDLQRRISVETSPNIRISPRIALSLALVFHELISNATKFGALSQQEGRVYASWTLEPRQGDAPLLHFNWIETGGPAISAPGQGGLGSRLIRSMIEYELEGRAIMDFANDGLRCLLSFPLAEGLKAP
ncbi:HWE histidine kinase domain-containing protein [Rhizobium sp. FKL33]|uniref:sensor histidine kinase n=1 Tax=Rhizobium sp. FKL33 TaxID=2562307 RepID=UPI0010C01F7A|nr:HWE histidine kinase domain-containing protein [Rhizobium sp. FKL33]